ncbi:LacI family transcriptional regulator, partial [bacterium]
STHQSNMLASDRIKGFQRALSEFGVPERPEWVMHSGDFTSNESSGAELGDWLLAMKERPTALCIVNDSAAQACVARLIRGEVRVPEDMSVITHDDLPIARFGVVPLTAVSHPIDETAEVIVEMLIDRLENRSDAPPRCVNLKGELRVRDSTAPLIT